MTRCPICDREHDYAGMFILCRACGKEYDQYDRWHASRDDKGSVADVMRWAAARARAPLAAKLKRVEAVIEKCETDYPWSSGPFNDAAQRQDAAAHAAETIADELRAALKGDDE